MQPDNYQCQYYCHYYRDDKGPPTTTTATTTDVMLWITKFHEVSQCLTWHNKKVIGAPCEAYQPAQLWEYTKKGEIVLHMNQLCLTGTSLYVSLTECDGSELQNFTAKTDDWTNMILMSQSKCLYFRMDMGKRIFLGPWDPSKSLCGRVCLTDSVQTCEVVEPRSGSCTWLLQRCTNSFARA